MKVLVVGATGLLGQALMREVKAKGYHAIGAARTGADLCLDVTDQRAVGDAVNRITPDVIINSAALVSLGECEKKPDLAYSVNARSVSFLAEAARIIGSYFIQISTDHYYTGDQNGIHNEICPVRIINEYARTKYLGEQLALTYEQSLVVRTNIVGFRDTDQKLSFIEGIIKSFQNQDKLTLFDDFYTSSIEVGQFSKCLMDIVPERPTGVYNLASRQVASKAEFISALAKRLEFSLDNAVIGSVKSLSDAKRAESLGLDVSKVEHLLGYSMPELYEVIEAIALVYERRVNCEIR
jgi:dTDP-4-dehydrorhamnose reductase